MVAPNIVNVTSIIGRTAVANVTAATANTIISNPGSSNQVFKVNTVTVANYTAAVVSANVDIQRGGASFLIIGNVAVPSNSTIVVSGKDTAFYLEEGDALRISANGNCYAISSFEVIS